MPKIRLMDGSIGPDAARERATAGMVLEPGQVRVAYSAKAVMGPGLRQEAAKASDYIAARSRQDARRRVFIEETIKRAGRTLKRLPPPKELTWLKGNGSSWPKVIRDFADLIGNEAEWKRRRQAPRVGGATHAEIAELDTVLGWLVRLDPDERFVAMGKMVGLGFRRIARRDRAGRSHTTLAKIYDLALERMGTFTSG